MKRIVLLYILYLLTSLVPGELRAQRKNGQFDVYIGGWVYVNRSVRLGCTNAVITLMQQNATPSSFTILDRHGDFDSWQTLEYSYSKTIDYNQKIIGFTTKFDLSDSDFWGNCGKDRSTGEKTTFLYLPMPSPFPSIDRYKGCYTAVDSDPFNHSGHMPGELTVSIAPHLSDALVQPFDNNLPVDDEIDVMGPIGLDPAIYYWEFSPDFGNTWYPVPAAFQYKDVFRTSARTLFSETPALNVTDYVGSNILVRMNACGRTRPSNYIIYNIRLSSPHISNVTTENIRCFGEAGHAKIFFDRALNSNINETLSIFIEKNNPDGTTIPLANVPNAVLNADNSFDWPDGIPGGDYTIRLIGKCYPPILGGGEITNYTDDAGHRFSFHIDDVTPVVIGTPAPGHVHCYNGNDGTITVGAGGGSGGYKLFWKGPADAAFTESPLGAGNTVTLRDLTAGAYTLYLRDANNCVGKDSKGDEMLTVTLTQPSAPLALDAQDLSDPKAFGYSDGSITVYLKGGQPNGDGSYNITWTRNGTPIAHTGAAASGAYASTVSNLPEGVYVLTVTDANYAAAGGNNTGCTLSASFTLTQPPLLEVSASVKDSVLCNGDGNGALTAVATGGKPVAAPAYYAYEWYRMEGGGPVALGQTGAEANGLTAGQYFVKVTDANGIEKESNIVNLVEPAELQIQLTTQAVNCYGGSDGAVSAVVTGGTPVYAYTWSNGSAAAALNGLPAGNYGLQVRDYHGCRAQDLGIVDQPNAPLSIITPVDITYPRAFGYTDGSIRLELTGGTPFADGSYTIEWKDAGGAILGSHTGTATGAGYQSQLNNLGAGTYTITVTDAHHAGAASNAQTCFVTGSFTLTEPPALMVDVTETHYVSCKGDADGQLTAHATGGVPISSGPLRYQYAWYRITGGIAQPIGQTTDIADGLTAGIYKVIITDWNGITKESAIFELKEPELLQVLLTSRNVSCYGGNDGFVKSTVTGGTLPYSYSWSTGDIIPDLTEQPAGSYSLLLTDGHGCMQQPTATITQPAAALSIVNVTSSDPTAYGYTDGSIKVTLAGGTQEADGAYHIQWLDANDQPLTTLANYQSGTDYVTELQQAGDGSYTLRVQDAQYAICTNGSTSGCYVAGAYSLQEPPLLKAVIEQHRYISCKGDADGQLVAHATGGIPATGGLPYRYQWFSVVNGSNVAIPQTDSIITGMPIGTYIVRVTDENNITRESPAFFLEEPGKLEITFTATPVSCASGQDGTATATVHGGTAPFHFEWTTGDTTAGIGGLTEGSHLLFVKDAHGCETQNQLDIFIPGGITITPDIKAPTCHGDCDGSISIVPGGGVPPYRYQWSNGSTGTRIERLCAGQYTLTILDANNCKRIQTFNLPDPPPIQINLGSDKTLCNGQSWPVSAAIADPLARYAWESDQGFRASTAAVTLNASGLYRVTVTDSKGCTGGDDIRIQQSNTAISAEFVASTQAFRNENVAFVNISDPSPERVEWVIPANSGITVIQQTPALAELRFANTGVYQVGLRAFVGSCEQVFSKSITVLEQQSFPQPGGAQQPFIRSFDVSPNPNGGQFNVRIGLDKQAAIRLRMINIISNQLVNDRQESPASQFNIGYELNVPAGTYLLLLETPMGNAIRKIVIN